MIPDFLPVLRRGPGDTPKDGGCLTQVVSFLKDGKSWTDKPECVHPVLGTLSIVVNDDISNTARPRLALLIPDLMDTNRDDPVLAVRLAIWCAKQVLPIWHRAYPEDNRPAAAIAAAEAWCDCPCQEHSLAADAAYAASAYIGYVADASASHVAVHAAVHAAYAAVYAAYAAAHAAVRGAPRSAALAISLITRSADRDKALYNLLTGAIAEHRRLTGHQPVEIDPVRWAEVCEMLGVAS